MSFFDEFKRSASDAANKAVKKTGEITNIAKLNIALKTNEVKLAGVFEEIGHMFYDAQRNGADNTSEIASAIMKADKIKADIENCKAEIAKLKKVIICPNCGKENPEDAFFCSYCGTKQEKPEPECCCGDTECCCDDDSECACECEDTECDCTDCCEEENSECCCGCDETSSETEGENN